MSLHSQGKWSGRRRQTGLYRYKLSGLLGPGCECHFHNLEQGQDVFVTSSKLAIWGMSPYKLVSV